MKLSILLDLLQYQLNEYGDKNVLVDLGPNSQREDIDQVDIRIVDYFRGSVLLQTE